MSMLVKGYTIIKGAKQELLIHLTLSGRAYKYTEAMLWSFNRTRRNFFM